MDSACPARWITGRCGLRNSHEMWDKVVFVSATPAPYELEKSGFEVVEQIIRPTGLVDPEIFVYPASIRFSI